MQQFRVHYSCSFIANQNSNLRKGVVLTEVMIDGKQSITGSVMEENEGHGAIFGRTCMLGESLRQLLSVGFQRAAGLESEHEEAPSGSGPTFVGMHDYVGHWVEEVEVWKPSIDSPICRKSFWISVPFHFDKKRECRLVDTQLLGESYDDFRDQCMDQNDAIGVLVLVFDRRLVDGNLDMVWSSFVWILFSRLVNLDHVGH